VPKLPLTVTSVEKRPAGLYAVTVAYFDGTTGTYLIPETMATVDAVRMSALAMGMLSDPVIVRRNHPHRKHQRYAPRT
jgi:hypothetical protein